MSNHLSNENSPYLLQHVDNPVEWYPWGEEALQKARREDKPIFLSIGYAACHWCHVMAHESFEDARTAAIMNEHFVNIKVDREERPDLDSIYMNAVVATTGQGGWPMSVFLTPDGKPFYGGTYFPPVRRYQMPAFSEILLSIAQLWREDRARLLKSGEELTQHLKKIDFLDQAVGELEVAKLDQAAITLTQTYDWKFGGWGKAPKFPQPMSLEYLLLRVTRGNTQSIDLVSHALHAMAKGGMYDVIGGGFARYSIDDKWLIPHFEKMLYDNALLASTYLHAYVVTGDPVFRLVCESTLEFILREMSHPQGGFFSSIDADSEGEEGKFYTWTPAEVQAVFSNPNDADFLIAAYQITEAGNFEGKNILQRALTDQQLADEFDLDVEEVPSKLKKLHKLLLNVRSQRERPGTDDKVLVFWNALALSSFAEAGRYLSNSEYTAVAKRNASFILDNLYQDDRLLRSWRDGDEGSRARYNAYLEDYASMILGLISLYQSDHDPRWYTESLRLADEMVTHFSDARTGFFDTRDDHEELLLRPKDTQDNATPSGNSLAAAALLQLHAYGDRPEWRILAENMIVANQELMSRYPTAFSQWLCAANFAVGPVYEVAIVGDPSETQTRALVNALWNEYRPRVVSGVSRYPAPPEAPALFRDRPLADGKATAYVCQNFVCKRPVNTDEEMLEQLEDKHNNL